MSPRRRFPQTVTQIPAEISGHQRSNDPRHGQSAVEYSVLIAVAVASLLAMQIYMKRGISGKMRQAADSIGTQYGPKETTSSLTLKISTDTTTASTLVKDQVIGPGTQTADVLVTTTTLNNSKTERTGNESVGPLQSDLWQ